MYQVIFTVTEENKDPLVDILFGLGAGSVSAEPLDGKQCIVTALFNDLEKVRETFADGYAIKKLHENDWKYKWLEGYTGCAVDDSIYIHPSFSAAPPPVGFKQVIIIDPSDAFGDGRHPTTHLCLVALRRLLEQYTPAELESLSLIDIGTGTGVLAIYVSLAGVRRVDACDIDNDAVVLARRNAELNGCESIHFTCADIADAHPDVRYDIIIANLLTGILMENFGTISSMLKDTGHIIVSGVSDQWETGIRPYFSEKAFRVIEHTNRLGWNCFLLGK